jgi:hypothetical protein
LYCTVKGRTVSLDRQSNKKAKARKTDNLLTTFATKKNSGWTPNKFETHVLDSYVVYLKK